MIRRRWRESSLRGQLSTERTLPSKGSGLFGLFRPPSWRHGEIWKMVRDSIPGSGRLHGAALYYPYAVGAGNDGESHGRRRGPYLHGPVAQGLRSSTTLSRGDPAAWHESRPVRHGAAYPVQRTGG